MAKIGYLLEITNKKDGVANISLNGFRKQNPGKIMIDKETIPYVVDEIPFLALLSACSGYIFELADGFWLKNKESDRISATYNVLSAVFDAELCSEGFVVYPKIKRNPAQFDHSDDHRIEMLSAIVAAIFGEKFLPNNAVLVSFPKFREIYEQLTYKSSSSDILL